MTKKTTRSTDRVPERVKMDSFTSACQRLQAIVAPLLAWYDRNKRAMPWRDQPDPYRVWVSEIMLQQTRVEAVIPYFERFIAAFPDVPTLAAASLDRVLKLWEGLGYYSRARNMHRAAQELVALADTRRGRALPEDPAVWATLPGVGPYTAGAIASIAYQKPEPAVDGNVIRVCTRLLGDRSETDGMKYRRALAEQLRPVIPLSRPGDFSQALMELGALVCLPGKAARCTDCPLAERCEAHAQGNPQAYPVRRAARPRKQESRTVLALRTPEGLLIRQRPTRGLLAGLWEFPHLSGTLAEDDMLQRVREWGFQPEAVWALPARTHLFTHLEWYLHGWYVRATTAAVPDTAMSQQWHSVSLAQLRADYAMPAAFSPWLDSIAAYDEMDTSTQEKRQVL